MKGYRTYLFLIAAFVMQVLNVFGFTEVTGEELNKAIEVFLLIGIWIYHRVHNV
jgi:hypothetical protein